MVDFVIDGCFCYWWIFLPLIANFTIKKRIQFIRDFNDTYAAEFTAFVPISKIKIFWQTWIYSLSENHNQKRFALILNFDDSDFYYVTNHDQKEIKLKII